MHSRRAEVELAAGLELVQAGGDVGTDRCLGVALVFHEQAAAGPLVLNPADSRPRLGSRDACPLLGVDDVEPVAPRRRRQRRAPGDDRDREPDGITELRRIRL